MNAANIIEIKRKVIKFLDGVVLSVLCELEIYDINQENVAVPGKNLQMRGKPWVISSIFEPVNIYTYLPKIY